MPVEFLSDERVAAYGCFVGVPSRADVERFFYLDDTDRDLIARRRSNHHRLGFAVQLGTVRAVGRFLEDPLQVPWVAVEFLAEQLGIGDASCVKQYVQRPQTVYEHAWEIRDWYGYRSFDGQGAEDAFGQFLTGRAWTHAEGPVTLFDHAVAWLRRDRVLLPGVSVLARRVSTTRKAAETRLYVALSGSAGRVDPRLPHRLARLLKVPDGSRVSTLEQLRLSPHRSSGPEMVKALQRAEQIAGLGTGRVDVADIPANRLQELARTGLGSKATALARLSEPKRTATLMAAARHLEAAAVDDTLDLFALLMATRLFSPARRASAEQRLALLPRLEKASKTVARAGRVLLDALAAAEASREPLDVAVLWSAVETVASRAAVAEAIGLVEELVPDEDGSAESALRTAARLGEAGEDARARVVAGSDGRARVHVDHLDALGEPETLLWLRGTAQAMLPRVDLPELPLEVHAWTGFLHAYTHLAGAATRTKDLPVSVAALLLADACNVGLTPVIKPGDAALSRARLAHVDQYYVRADNHAAANAILIDAQARMPITQAWGGGLLASVDGLRFVVPVRTINAGPSPKYFGHQRGITWLNVVNDQIAGIGQMVVPVPHGTRCSSWTRC